MKKGSGTVGVREFDELVERDEAIEELMKPVAQVAMMRLEGVHGMGAEQRRNAVDRILAGARSGLLRVRGMAHPEHGRLVHDSQDLESIARPLAVPSDVAEDGRLVVPDVFFVDGGKAWLRPWQASSEVRTGSDGQLTFEDFHCVTRITKDEQGRLLSKEEFVDGPVLWSFKYDEEGRLATVFRGGKAAELYEYDELGRRSRDLNLSRGTGRRVFEYADDNRMLTAGNTRCVYDENGALSVKWPGRGEEEPLRLEHDGGRIARITLGDGRVVEYAYDYQGCRTERRVDGKLQWECEWLDLIRLGAVRDVQRNVTVSFEYGVDAEGRVNRVPLRMAVSHGTGLPARKYGLICDLRGSLRSVRNEEGQLIQVIEYDSFGNVIRRQGRDEGKNMFVPLGFAGGLPDPDHDFVHFVFRDYDPDVGRWTAIDPLGYQGGDLDLYGYCGDDPVNWVDVLGLTRMYDVINRANSLNFTRGLGFGWKPSSGLRNASKYVTRDPEIDSPLFATAQQAAMHGLVEFSSRNLPFEVAGNIYQTRENDFFHDAYPGTREDSWTPRKGLRAGVFHTHIEGNNFSLRDFSSADEQGLTSYMINPKKELFRYDPQKDVVSIFREGRNVDGFEPIGSSHEYTDRFKSIDYGKKWDRSSGKK